MNYFERIPIPADSNGINRAVTIQEIRVLPLHRVITINCFVEYFNKDNPEVLAGYPMKVAVLMASNDTPRTITVEGIETPNPDFDVLSSYDDVIELFNEVAIKIHSIIGLRALQGKFN